MLRHFSLSRPSPIRLISFDLKEILGWPFYSFLADLVISWIVSLYLIVDFIYLVTLKKEMELNQS